MVMTRPSSSAKPNSVYESARPLTLISESILLLPSGQEGCCGAIGDAGLGDRGAVMAMG